VAPVQRWLPNESPLPTDAIDLERQPELQADHIEAEDLSQLWAVLKLEEETILFSHPAALLSPLLIFCGTIKAE